MRILVVCGAGASSTFVAQRLRRAAQAQGRQLRAIAGTEQSLPIDLDAADIVLVGSHLTRSMPQIEADARVRGTRVILLPADIADDLEGSRSLAIVDAALAGSPLTSGRDA